MRYLLVLWESWGDPDEGIDLVYRLRRVAEAESGHHRKGFLSPD